MTSTPSCPSACHYKAIFHNVYLMLPPISPPNVLSDEIHTVTSSVPRQTAAKCNSNSYLFFILAHFIANTSDLFPPIALQVYSFSSTVHSQPAVCISPNTCTAVLKAFCYLFAHVPYFCSFLSANLLKQRSLICSLLPLPAH